MKNPKCRHTSFAAMVTNSPEGLRPTGPHASVRVCPRPTCILDAMSIVMTATGEKPWWRADGGEWSDTPPAPEVITR